MQERGLLALFARHPVAGNLLLVLMLLFGAWGLTQLNRQVLPDFTLDIIRITVQWPGASPEDVEANVVKAIEPEVRFLDDVHRVDAMAYEGRAEITVEFEAGASMSKALTDVQAAVSRITTFPADIERPVISQVFESDEVCSIEISGPFDEAALKVFAKRIRDGLLARGLERVTLQGARDSEIWVELSEERLRQLDMSVGDVAQRIRESSLDLPAGSIETGRITRQIRSETMARSAREVGEIELLARPGGESLRVRDVARVRETFEENSVSHWLRGQRAIGLRVTRSGALDSLEAQRTVTEYLEELRAELPPTLKIDLFDVFADQATQRIRMLINNGLTGLLLVLAVLFLFLNGRVAFWVAMGIPVSIMAALGGMAMLGMTLNMISMFAIIMGLGIIVDDAIVVGEHTEMLHRHGMPPAEAASTGARVMLAPVMAASLTTIAAFFPLLTVSSEVGQIIRELPLTIILVIVASLTECFLVLPMHLRHALERLERSPRRTGRFNALFLRFREGHFSARVRAAFAQRYSVVLATLCCFALALTLLLSGRVGFEFFASPETDMLFANFALSPGTPRARSEAMLAELARSLDAVEQRLTAGEGGLVVYAYGTVGTTGGRAGEAALSGDHTGAYTVELASSDLRRHHNPEIIAAWQAEVRPVAGVERLVFFERSAGGPPGRDLDIRLYGAELDVLKQAAVDLARELEDLPGVTAVEDNLPYGKPEVELEITPAGQAMGFSAEMVARQLRDAYEGAIARRFAEDQEEIVLRVKLAEAPGLTRPLATFHLRAPDGSEVPLAEVARLETSRGFAQIRREDGLRQVSVTADVDPGVTTSNEVLAALAADAIPALEKRYGIRTAFKGKAEEQAQAMGETGIALLLALATIYVILAWVFASYTTPLIVMSVIPFGLVGAIFGHWVMGYNVNMLSLMALLGLGGVMVNDSIILVATVRRLQAQGIELVEAIPAAARERLRPVILTTLTTIGGLTPLLFERSLQAQLVQPLAVTLIFGLMFSPYLVMFFVPALLGIGDDLGRRLRRPPGREALQSAGK
ncbi:MAG: efflux RND transporter permease subunit [Gammaproteobacteria bacterium]|nr:MAG: efflux RND transporter permease subunit [Gammaproteobacteria bacterium]